MPFIDSIKEKTKKITHHKDKKNNSGDNHSINSSVSSIQSSTTNSLKRLKSFKSISSKNRNSVNISPSKSINSNNSLPSRNLNIKSDSSINSTNNSSINQSTLVSDTINLSSAPLTTNETTKTILSTTTVDTLVSDLKSSDNQKSNLLTPPTSTSNSNSTPVNNPASKTPVILDIPNFSVDNNTNNIPDKANDKKEKIKSPDMSTNPSISMINNDQKIVTDLSNASEAKSTDPKAATTKIPNDDDKFSKLKEIILNYLSLIKDSFNSMYKLSSQGILSIKNKSCQSISEIFNNSMYGISYTYKKSLEISKSGYSNINNYIKSHPLTTYNLIYISACAIIAEGATIYHDKFLTTKSLAKVGEICENCNHDNKLIHIGIPVAIAVSIMGIGNYVYLKKNSKKT